MKQNITLSIEQDLLKKGKILAVKQDTSVSQMLSDELEKLVKHAEKYEAAKKQALANLKKAKKLGKKNFKTREELYER